MSTQALQHSSSLQLASFVRLNEGIKGVVLIAFQINIMALNAILLSHRAGEVALGFGVISKELRTLSVELTRLMQALSTDAYLAVNLISDQLRRERRQQLLQTTQTQLQRPSAALDAIVAERKTLFLARAQQVREVRLRLLDQLEEARKLCQFGTAISRSAKIEAAYGREYGRALAEVSQEFDQKIQTILPSIETLCAGMQRL
ncbi:methyl-accepting chemotaxis protein [Vogesella amnigena]|uniref:Methyl-accepting chemotaxis protein n=1 Tax=Vogesella amnigena TaxID=1507449 RepID=A0ABV7TV31_9NEIS